MKRIEAQLEQLARDDTLTGLANRHFEEKLSEFSFQLEQEPFAMLFLDIGYISSVSCLRWWFDAVGS